MRFVNYRDAGFRMPSHEEWQRIRLRRMRLKKIDARAVLKQPADLRPRLKKKA